MTSIVAVDVLAVCLPFRFSFGHALAARTSSTSVVVRVRLDDGTVGYGEGVPREYVTGETVDGALSALCERQAPVVLGRKLGAPADVAALLEEVPGIAPDGSLDLAARCALELAVLDAAGKHLRRPVSDWLGGGATGVRYDAVLPFSSPRKLAALALAVRALGIRQVKVKVGADLERELHALRTLRRLLGSTADLRVDANCAWSGDEALTALERMRRYRLSAVEQPVAAGDLDGLRRLTSEAPEAIVVDESLRTADEARRLVEQRACDAFNIRVSKCGGLLSSLALARTAAAAGLFCVVGAQVGESGILSAAGRHLAAAIRPRFLEGSGGSLLLKEDLTVESVLPGLGGRARALAGPGLGVRVKEATLRRYGRLYRTLEAEMVQAR